MTSKIFRIARMIVVATLGLSSAAWATTCSNASLSGTYGFLHDSTDSNGAPSSAAITQITFDPSTGTFTGVSTASHDGVIVTDTITGTYAIASNCTGVGIPTGANRFSIVVTSTGFLAVHPFAEGFAVKQGLSNCTNATGKGNFAFETTGIFVAGESSAAVDFIGELKFTVNSSGEGMISGQLAGSENGSILTFAEEPVTGSYTIFADCRGTVILAATGLPEMHYSLVVVGGNEMLAIETDANTVVSGTLVKGD